MTNRQKANIQIIGATALAVLAFVFMWEAAPRHLVETFESRLLLMARLLSFFILPLIIGIGVAVVMRYRNDALLIGESDDNRWFLLVQTFNRNTLEQTVVAVMLLVAFCLLAESSRLHLANLYLVLWMAGRFLFLAGYVLDPVYRLLGFALGWYSSLIILLLSLYWILV